MGVFCSLSRDMQERLESEGSQPILSARSIGEIRMQRELLEILEKNPNAKLLINKHEKYRINMPVNQELLQRQQTLELNSSNIKMNMSQIDNNWDINSSEEQDQVLDYDEYQIYKTPKRTRGQNLIQTQTIVESQNLQAIPATPIYNKQETRALNIQRKTNKSYQPMISIMRHSSENQGYVKQFTNVETRKYKRDAFSNSQRENCIHFAYLYASPLVLEIEGMLKEDVLGEIGFKEEFDQIINALEDDKTQIRYRYQLGTIQNLSECLRQQPLGLHFSGHGLQNIKSAFKDIAPINYHSTIDKKGDILVFEGTDGGKSQFLFQDELQKILFQHNTDLKFVVVASCHSEMCGKVFKKSGAEHVICIQQDKEVKDNAAITFSRAFYINVFSSRKTICQAYENAIFLVEKKFGKKEAEIFRLMTQDGHVCDRSFALMDELQPGEMISVIKKPNLLIMPSQMTQWIPRDLETYDIIQKLLFDGAKIIEVFGFSGVGKSAIITKVANYIAERQIYLGGIIYVNCSGIDNIKEAFAYLIQKIDLHSNKTFSKMQTLKKLKEKELLQKVSQFTLSSQKVLFIFDNIEQIVQNDSKQLINSFNQLVCERDNLQILFTTSLYVSGLERFVVKNLKSLSSRKAAELFVAKIPLDEARKQLYDKKTILELNNLTLEQENYFRAIELLKLNKEKADLLSKLKLCNQPCTNTKHKKDVNLCLLAYLERHPLFQILTEPLSICLAASQLHYLTISQLYNKILNSKMITEKDDALFMNIIHAIQVVNQQYEYSTELLFVVGQTPQGLSYEDLEMIFKEKNNIQEVLQLLQDTSLLEKDGETDWYKVQNFIAKFIEQQLDDNKEMKIQYNIRLASFYEEIINLMKVQVSDRTRDLESMIKLCDYYEKNILACLTYLLSVCFPDDDSLQKKKNNAFVGKLKVMVANNEISKQLIKQLTLNVKKQMDSNQLKRQKRKLKQGSSTNDMGLINIAVEQVLKKFGTAKSINVEDDNNLDIDLGDLQDISHLQQINLNNQKSNLSYLQGISQGTTQKINSSDSSNSDSSDFERDYKQQSQSMVINYQTDQKLIQETYEVDMNIDKESQNDTRSNITPLVSIGKLDDYIRISIIKKLSLQREVSKQQDQLLIPTKDTLSVAKSVKHVNNKSIQLDFHDNQNTVLNNLTQRFQQQTRGGNSNSNNLSPRSFQNDNDLHQVKSSPISLPLNNVLGKYISKELQKMSDQVTDQEKAKYKKTLSKFKLFDKMIQVKPTEALASFFAKQLNNFSGKEETEEEKQTVQPIDMQKIETNASSIASQLMKLKQQRLLSKPDLTLQQVTSSHSSNSQATTPRKMAQKQSTVKLQGQVSSNIAPSTITHKRRKTHLIGQQLILDENIQVVTEEQKKHNMIMGHASTLLYHYLSIQALKNIEPHELEKLQQKYHLDDMNPIFKANTELLMVYLLLIRGNVESASVYLEQIAKIFKDDYCIRGMGIFNFFMAYIFYNLKSRNHSQMVKTNFKAQNYLNKAEQYFYRISDSQALSYCDKLRELIDLKLDGGQQFDQITNNNGRRSFNKSLNITPESSRNRNDFSSAVSANNEDIKSFAQLMLLNKIGDGQIQNGRFDLLQDEPCFNLLLNLVSLGSSENFINNTNFEDIELNNNNDNSASDIGTNINSTKSNRNFGFKLNL